MRIAIAGAGAVGRSIAQALLAGGPDGQHKVLLIERRWAGYRPQLVPAADWLLADACEVENLRGAGIDTCDVVMAATGDDKVNLVFSMLSKTEFQVPRVVARVNEPRNQWLFGSDWGVDVAVSTPGSLVAAVEEAVEVGDIVRLMTLQRGQGDIVEVRLTGDSALVGGPVAAVGLPGGAAVLAIVRDGTLIAPWPEFELRAGDELLLLATPETEDELRALFHRR